jgi:ubiquinone/menaquinone biosynthesis C-methylase UbiE
MSTIYSGDRQERATNTNYLERRLQINKSYASADFDAWLFSRLAVREGEDVLDVGCGSGAQTVPFAKQVGATGSVSALDISTESVELLKGRLPPGARVRAVASDMALLAEVIARQFDVKRYDLAHSSYALYYSPKRLEVLDVMRGALKEAGRCAVFTPDAPHGLVELASRYSSVPESVFDSLTFGQRVLKPYFDAAFRSVEEHRFHNMLSLPDADVVIEFYRQTTYYDAAAEARIREHVAKEIAANGVFRYEKNGYLIIGRV